MEAARGPGLRLARTDHPGAPPPLLALHGLASNRRWWDLVAARLPHRLIAADLRGHGESPGPPAGYGFDAVAADVLALADDLGLERFAVAGHSWGAAVALWLAAGHPQRVLCCVCVDGGFSDLRERFPGGWKEAREALRPPDLVGVRRSTLARWAGGQLAEGSDPASAAEILMGNFEPVDPGVTEIGDDTRLRPRLRLERHMEIARHLFELDSEALLARVPVPVTAVLAGGGQDAWERARRTGAERAGTLLGHRLRVRWVEGGHDLPVQRPAEVAEALEEALAGL